MLKKTIVIMIVNLSKLNYLDNMLKMKFVISSFFIYFDKISFSLLILLKTNLKLSGFI